MTQGLRNNMVGELTFGLTFELNLITMGFHLYKIVCLIEEKKAKTIKNHNHN